MHRGAFIARMNLAVCRERRHISALAAPDNFYGDSDG